MTVWPHAGDVPEQGRRGGPPGSGIQYEVIAEVRVDSGTERYVFEGEKSWARYETHGKNVFPGQPGVVDRGGERQPRAAGHLRR